jgi:hypothetical protein
MSKNFSGKRLMAVNFAGQDLEGADFSSASITGCNFSGANLEDADFSDAKCTGCNFSGTNLTNAQFSDASFVGSNFLGADLDGANLEDAKLTGCNLGPLMMEDDAQSYEEENDEDEVVDSDESGEDSDEESDDETDGDLHEIVDCEWVKVLATNTPWSKKSHLEIYEIRDYNVAVSSIELHFHVCLVHLERLPGSQVLVRLREVSDGTVEVSEWTLDPGEHMSWEDPQTDGWALSVEAPETQH